jgi:signal peptidase I
LAEKPDTPAKPRSWLQHLWQEWIKPLLVVGSILLSFRSSIVDWNDVPSGSMKPTILEGDRVFVNKLAYDLKLPFLSRCSVHSQPWSCVFGWDYWFGGQAIQVAHWGDPKRGDIVVLWSPHDGKRLVKRVVAIPGDKLEVVRQQLVVNGKPALYGPLEGEVLKHAGVDGLPLEQIQQETVEGRSHAVWWFASESTNASFGPIVVPAGQYFAMGDHRDDSFDSRFFGFIERERIVGRAVMVVASLDIKHGWRPRWRRFFSGLI